MSRRSWVALLASVTLLALGLPAPIAGAITQPNQITYVNGKTTVSGTSSASFLGFTGRENDSTGTLSLYNYRARAYSPTLHRFLTEDPIGFAGGYANLYPYVGDAPTAYTDPIGLFIDVVLDVGFVFYDVYSVFTGGRKDLGENLFALGLDLLALFIPFGTGFGAVGRHVAASSDEIAVIGRTWDTAVAKHWAGHAVLDIQNWTIAKNDAWVRSVIDRRMRLYIASPETKANLWDTVNNRSTVFGRELQEFLDAGYTRSGDYLHPPVG